MTIDSRHPCIILREYDHKRQDNAGKAILPTTLRSGYFGPGIDAPNIFIERRGKPICDVSPMSFGNMPLDGGNLLLNSEEEDDLVVNKYPQLEDHIKAFMGADEFLNLPQKDKTHRYCLWFPNGVPSDV